MGKCTAKLRPFRPLNDTEISCYEKDEHDTHEGALLNYAYKGSETVMKWFENDRRTYHNEWPGNCESTNCILPLGHEGNHAT